ncbi:MAG: dihydroorotate dehydrogenase [Candidatus Omnitrophota bacterium]
MKNHKSSNLEVNVGGLKLKNPVMVASGTFGSCDEYSSYMNYDALGAFVTKTITKQPRLGNKPPRIYETASGMLNSVGLQNEGLDEFVHVKLKKLKNLKTKLIVSVGGERSDDYIDIIKELNRHACVSAIELNISCPNIEYDNCIIAQDPVLTQRLVKQARRVTDRPLIVKLSPNVRDIVEIAQAAREGGADAVSLINTLLGMAIDVDKRRSILGNITGGLSGPAIKPVALRMVWQVYKKVDLPIIGMGGIMSARDAIEFFIAGAAAVAVGTANFVAPAVSFDIIKGIGAYLKKHNFSNIDELIGSLNEA